MQRIPSNVSIKNSAITQLPNENIKSHAQNMNTAQPLSSEKQHTSRSFTLFTSQNSTEPENYLNHKNDICVVQANAWKTTQMYFLPILSGVIYLFIYIIIFFLFGLHRGKKI
jgi:hypothetical protein